MTAQIRGDDIRAIRLLDEPVRRRLYEWVIEQGRPVGRDEAARTLGIGRPLAAFHLERLADAGLLDSGYRRLSDKRGPGAGRPARVYWRGEREFSVSLPSRRYERVAELFATALERLGADAANVPVQNVAEELGERAVEESPAAASTEPGVGRLLAVLDSSGYEPVPTDDGTIRLRNCPFHALVAEHRDLVCGANLAMAEGMVHSADAERRVVPVLDPQAGYCCVAFKPAGVTAESA
jgi:predicted ArsR family transcriptional regulator